MSGAGRVLGVFNGRGASGAGLLAAVLLAAGLASAYASAGPGWRIVATDNRAGVDSQNTVLALSATNAWTGGGAAPSHTTAGTPFIEHWQGRNWTLAKLPAGLAGSVMVLAASAPNNVWAFGQAIPGSGGFALRYDGSKWTAAKRWAGLISFAGAVVRSPTNVWAFSRVSGLAQHYDGHTWRGVNLLPVSGWIDSVASLPDGQIWAVGNMVGPVVITGTPTGTSYSWNVATVPGVQSGSAGDSLTSILARSANDVWAIGGNLNIVSGHNHWFPIVAHWNGTAWTLVKVTGTFMLGGHGIADDGQGGLWLTSAWDNTGVPPYLLHFTGGKLVKVNLPPRGGRYLCIADLARIPASTSVWGVGAWTGLGSAGPNTGVILKYGN